MRSITVLTALTLLASTVGLALGEPAAEPNDNWSRGFVAEHSDPAMALAHDRLRELLAQGVADNRPALTAKAKDSFECWLIDQEESPPSNDPQDCRTQFLTALLQLEQHWLAMAEDGEGQTAELR